MFRTVFDYLIIIPILCISSVVLILHEFMPSFYRFCIKPAVSRMREDRSISYEYMGRTVTVRMRSGMPFVSAFNKELDVIIMLIKLVSDGIGVDAWGGGENSFRINGRVFLFGLKLTGTPFLFGLEGT